MTQSKTATNYAVAIREGDNLSLAMSIRRSFTGRICVVPPQSKNWGDEEKRLGYKHVTYHENGWLHARLGQVGSGENKKRGKYFGQQRQKPDELLRGCEGMCTPTIVATDVIALKMACEVAEYAGTFEVPIQDLAQEQRHFHCLGISFVEPGNKGLETGWEIVRPFCFKDREPWILAALYRVPLSLPPGGTQ